MTVIMMMMMMTRKGLVVGQQFRHSPRRCLGISSAVISQSNNQTKYRQQQQYYYCYHHKNSDNNNSIWIKCSVLETMQQPQLQQYAYHVRWMSSSSSSNNDGNTKQDEVQENVTIIEKTNDNEYDTSEKVQQQEQEEEGQSPESLQGESPEEEEEVYKHKVTIKMPDMGEGNDNIIEKWYKQPGDIIKRNDVLCDITTPDFTFGMVIEDEDDSIMGEIFVQEGERADDGAPICTTWHEEP